MNTKQQQVNDISYVDINEKLKTPIKAIVTISGNPIITCYYHPRYTAIKIISTGSDEVIDGPATDLKYQSHHWIVYISSISDNEEQYSISIKWQQMDVTGSWIDLLDVNGNKCEWLKSGNMKKGQNHIELIGYVTFL